VAKINANVGFRYPYAVLNRMNIEYKRIGAMVVDYISEKINSGEIYWDILYQYTLS
jgi:hypothetical protein